MTFRPAEGVFLFGKLRILSLHHIAQIVALPLFFMALTALCLSGARVLGFSSDIMTGAAWESGVALVAAIRLRRLGIVAVFAAHVATEVAWGTPAIVACGDAAANAVAATAAAAIMRHLRRRQADLTHTREWLVFFVGLCLFVVVAVGVKLAVAISLGTSAEIFVPELTLAFIIEPLGVAGMLAVLSSLHEAPRLRHDAGVLLRAFAMTMCLVLAVEVLLRFFANPGETHSMIIMLLALPISVWLSLLPLSLGGAVISMVGYNSALWFVQHHLGTVYHPEYSLVAAGYLVLALAFQLVHALNLDRRKAMSIIENQNADLEGKIAQRTARLEEMIERAVAADAAKSEFLATMSHELRTPLNGILGMASIMLANDLDEDTRAQAEVVHSSGVHLLELISSVLEFSNLSHERAQSAEVTFDLNGLISNTLAEVSLLQESTAIGFFLEVDEAIPANLSGDPRALRRILTNLIGNAAKFTEEGQVEISAKLVKHDATGVSVIFAVEDTGIGISSDDFERIFEPFEQINQSANRAAGGTGLGLAVCATLLRQVNSRMNLESTVGAGSRFSFMLRFGEVTEQGRELRNNFPEAFGNPLSGLLDHENHTPPNSFGNTPSRSGRHHPIGGIA